MGWKNQFDCFLFSENLNVELIHCKTRASVVLKMFTFPFSQMRTIWLSNIGRWWCSRRDCPAIRPLFLVNLHIPISKCRLWSTKTPRSVRIIHKKNSNFKFKNSIFYKKFQIQKFNFLQQFENSKIQFFTKIWNSKINFFSKIWN